MVVLKVELPLCLMIKQMGINENCKKLIDYTHNINLFDNTGYLVECLEKGHDDAFEYLYNKYSKALYGVALRIIKDIEEANDILQETFIIILQKITLYDANKGSLFTWILKIVRNKACLLYTSPSPRDRTRSRMPSSA